MGEFNCVECFRTLLRIILVAVNIFISLLGLLVLSVGIYASVNGDSYYEIAGSNGAITQIPILMIVVGIFVLLLGVVGAVGGIFAGTIGGRIILGLYGFVLALLVICELAGGIAAGVERDQLGSSFLDSSNDTFAKYKKDSSIRKSWDDAQRTLKCCGNIDYTDYQKVLGDDTIPSSCCNVTNTDNADVCENLTATMTQYIYPQGCGTKIRDIFSHSLGVVAGVAITFGFLQVIGVVVSCFVAIAGSKKEGTYQVV